MRTGRLTRQALALAAIAVLVCVLSCTTPEQPPAEGDVASPEDASPNVTSPDADAGIPEPFVEPGSDSAIDDARVRDILARLSDATIPFDIRLDRLEELVYCTGTGAQTILDRMIAGDDPEIRSLGYNGKDWPRKRKTRIEKLEQDVREAGFVAVSSADESWLVSVVDEKRHSDAVRGAAAGLANDCSLRTDPEVFTRWSQDDVRAVEKAAKKGLLRLYQGRWPDASYEELFSDPDEDHRLALLRLLTAGNSRLYRDDEPEPEALVSVAFSDSSKEIRTEALCAMATSRSESTRAYLDELIDRGNRRLRVELSIRDSVPVYSVFVPRYRIVALDFEVTNVSDRPIEVVPADVITRCEFSSSSFTKGPRDPRDNALFHRSNPEQDSSDPQCWPDRVGEYEGDRYIAAPWIPSSRFSCGCGSREKTYGAYDYSYSGCRNFTWLADTIRLKSGTSHRKSQTLRCMCHRWTEKCSVADYLADKCIPALAFHYPAEPGQGVIQVVVLFFIDGERLAATSNRIAVGMTISSLRPKSLLTDDGKKDARELGIPTDNCPPKSGHR